MDATSPDPRSIRPGTMAGRCAVAVAYVGLYLLAALWGRDIQVQPGITPWFPAVGLTLALLVGFGLARPLAAQDLAPHFGVAAFSSAAQR